MKAVLVMDIPESCVDCQFCYEYHEGIEACCTVTREPSNDDMYRIIKEDYCQDKPDWCPLKPMPEKKDWKPSSGITLAMFGTGWNACIDEIMEGANAQYTNAGKWIPADNPPEIDETEISDYILLSFKNFPVPLVGIYGLDEEGNGAYYVGDSEKSCISQGRVVNAWMPLPKPCRGEEE